MTHTSTEQPDALRLADLCAADWDLVRPHLVVQMLRDLHARVQELEASQAQRVPLALHQRDTIKANAWRETMVGGYYDANAIIDATEAAHGITQEKQGCIKSDS